MTARQDILSGLRAANRGRSQPDSGPAALARRLAQPARGPVPARAAGGPGDLVTRFVDMALFASATVSRVADGRAAVADIAAYLDQGGFGHRVVTAPDAALEALPWHGAPELKIRSGPPGADDAVGITGALCGIAETGTVMVHSSRALPVSLCFLPETHIVVLARTDIVGAYEDGWARLRTRTGDDVKSLPRTVTLITGPSRTSDIEKTLQIGVHGPRRLHVVVTDGA